MQIITDYFKKVDFSKVRTNHPPELIFLCGGNNDEEANNFRPKLQDKLVKKQHNVILAESAMNWRGGQKFAKDLLELEIYFAALVSIIPLICESYGSAAELGAFVADQFIRKKLFIIIKEQFYSGENSSSFIRNGPIKKYEDSEGRKTYCINDKHPEQDLDDLYEALLSCRPKTSKCYFDKGYFRILLLIDIINVLSISTLKEIKISFQEVLSIIGIDQHEIESYCDDIDEMLFVLEQLNLIKYRNKGQQGFYLAVSQEFYLEYRYVKDSDDTKLSTIRKNILDTIYSQDSRINKTKVSILKEERKKGEIAWLQTNISLDDINVHELLKTAPLQYKVYEIPKKSGGKRTIAQPTAELKALQRKKISELEDKLPIHNCAKAYRKNKNGILDNAKAHKDNSYFYKFDFQDFFESIKACDFNQFLEQHGYSFSERVDLIKLFFRFNKQSSKQKTKRVYRYLTDNSFNRNNNPALLNLMIQDFANEFQLSVGAPSSPFISNAILFEFDDMMQNWANENDITYTRYADDITLSSKSKIDISSMEKEILNICSKISFPTLKLNKKKEKFCSFKQRVSITGLNITPDHKISIGRNMKREISAMIHHFKSGKLTVDKLNKLRGWLSYCKVVESEFIIKMENKYSKNTISAILRKK
ncbi:TPA: RNA-directed DNA polymerase [Legionella pneumophila]|nr:RNA-directed DNA polymerase [Legionella pneumophila]